MIGVTATGVLRLKSFYSNYGVGVTQVVAPGGDSILQRTAQAPNGRVLSTWPADLPCTRQVIDPGPNKPSSARAGSSGLVHVYGVNGIVKLRDRAE